MILELDAKKAEAMMGVLTRRRSGSIRQSLTAFAEPKAVVVARLPPHGPPFALRNSIIGAHSIRKTGIHFC